MGRSEKYRFGLAKEKRLYQIVSEQGWSREDEALAEELIGQSRFWAFSTLVPYADESCGRRYACCFRVAQEHVHQDFGWAGN